MCSLKSQCDSGKHGLAMGREDWAYGIVGEGVGTRFQVNSGFCVSGTLESQGLKAMEEKDSRMKKRTCVCACTCMVPARVHLCASLCMSVDSLRSLTLSASSPRRMSERMWGWKGGW